MAVVHKAQNSKW